MRISLATFHCSDGTVPPIMEIVTFGPVKSETRSTRGGSVIFFSHSGSLASF